jgi:hypothetical protein
MLAIELAKGDKYCADGTAVLRVAPRKGATFFTTYYLLLTSDVLLLTSYALRLTPYF